MLYSGFMKSSDIARYYAGYVDIPILTRPFEATIHQVMLEADQVIFSTRMFKPDLVERYKLKPDNKIFGRTLEKHLLYYDENAGGSSSRWEAGYELVPAVIPIISLFGHYIESLNDPKIDELIRRLQIMEENTACSISDEYRKMYHAEIILPISDFYIYKNRDLGFDISAAVRIVEQFSHCIDVYDVQEKFKRERESN